MATVPVLRGAASLGIARLNHAGGRDTHPVHSRAVYSHTINSHIVKAHTVKTHGVKAHAAHPHAVETQAIVVNTHTIGDRQGQTARRVKGG